MEALSTAVASVITLITTSFGTVGTALMTNSVFQLVVGTVIFSISMGVVYSLVKKLKRKGA